jgi:hypothetical protein
MRQLSPGLMRVGAVTAVAAVVATGCGGGSGAESQSSRRADFERAFSAGWIILYSPDETSGLKARGIADRITLGWLRSEAESDANLAIASEAADAAINQRNQREARYLLAAISTPSRGVKAAARLAVSWGMAAEAGSIMVNPTSNSTANDKKAIDLMSDIPDVNAFDSAVTIFGQMSTADSTAAHYSLNYTIGRAVGLDDSLAIRADTVNAGFVKIAADGLAQLSN